MVQLNVSLESSIVLERKSFKDQSKSWLNRDAAIFFFWFQLKKMSAFVFDVNVKLLELTFMLTLLCCSCNRNSPIHLIPV